MTYYIILSDINGNIDWIHPTEVEASNKQDAFDAIAESCPPDSIKKIFSAEEYKAFISNGKNKKNIQLENAASAGSENFNSGKDFFASMINIANKTAESNNLSEQPTPKQTTIQNQPQQYVEQPQQTPIQSETPKYFTDNGIKYKVDNGVIYKKCWEDLEINTITDDTGNTLYPDYRIINKETGKQIKSEKYIIQHLIWKPLNNI